MVLPKFVKKPFKRHRAGVKNRIKKAKAYLRWITKQNIALRENTEFDLSKQLTSPSENLESENNIESAKPVISALKPEKDIKFAEAVTSENPQIKSVLCTHLLYTILRKDGTVFRNVGPKSNTYALCDMTGENKELCLIKSPTLNNIVLKNNQFEFINLDDIEIIGTASPIQSVSHKDNEENIEEQNFEAFHALNLAARLSFISATHCNPRVRLTNIDYS